MRNTARPFQHAQGPRAFTLVELLVVMGVIGVLVALLMPVLSKAQEQARRTKCANSMNQVFTATRQYALYAGQMLPDLYAGIRDDTAKVNARYRTSHYARNTGPDGKETPCGLWLLVSTKAAPMPEVLYCPNTKGSRRFGGSDNPTDKVSGAPQIAGYAYNLFPDTTDDNPSPPEIKRPAGLDADAVSNDTTQPRALAFYALLADIFLNELQMPHGSRNGINVSYWDGSVQWVETATNRIPWNGTANLPDVGMSKTFTDDDAGYAAVRDAWALLSAKRH